MEIVGCQATAQQRQFLTLCFNQVPAAWSFQRRSEDEISHVRLPACYKLWLDANLDLKRRSNYLQYVQRCCLFLICIKMDVLLQSLSSLRTIQIKPDCIYTAKKHNLHIIPLDLDKLSRCDIICSQTLKRVKRHVYSVGPGVITVHLTTSECCSRCCWVQTYVESINASVKSSRSKL